jgi:hypothetical protein
MAKNRVGEPQAADVGRTDPANFQNSDIPKKRKYIVVHKFNCPLELNIGGVEIKFEPHGRNPIFPAEFKDGIPDTIINHPDFISAADNFVILEK